MQRRIQIGKVIVDGKPAMAELVTESPKTVNIRLSCDDGSDIVIGWTDSVALGRLGLLIGWVQSDWLVPGGTIGG